MRRFVVGLGNPGSTYARTRHNIGFRVLDHLAESMGATAWRRTWECEAAEVGDTWLLKPQTWMNRSGDALLAVMETCGIEPRALLVVADDVALPLGRIRIRKEGSAGGHNGLASIETALASRSYARLRVGVGGTGSITGDDLVAFVLGAFTVEEEARVSQVIPHAAAAVWCWCREGLDASQNRYNGWCPGLQPEGTGEAGAGSGARQPEPGQAGLDAGAQRSGTGEGGAGSGASQVEPGQGGQDAAAQRTGTGDGGADLGARQPEPGQAGLDAGAQRSGTGEGGAGSGA